MARSLVVELLSQGLGICMPATSFASGGLSCLETTLLATLATVTNTFTTRDSSLLGRPWVSPITVAVSSCALVRILRHGSKRSTCTRFVSPKYILLPLIHLLPGVTKQSAGSSLGFAHVWLASVRVAWWRVRYGDDGSVFYVRH